MKVIEFFGPPCSGKSYYRNFLLKKFPNLFISSDLLIVDYSKYLISLTFVEYLTLKYFKFIFKNKKKINLKNSKVIYTKVKKNQLSNFFLKNYREICYKIFIKYKKKNKHFFNFYKSLIKLVPKKQKYIYDIWFKELLAKIYIVDNCNFTNKVVLFDEGFIQRLNSLIKLKRKNSGLIKDYLKIMPKSDFLIYLDNFEKKLLNRSLVRKKKFSGFEYKNYGEIYNYKKFFKIVYKEILKSGNYIVK